MSAFFKNKKWTGKPKDASKMIPPQAKQKAQSFSSKNQDKYWKKTGTYLIIVESPSKCKKIEEYLGSQYNCIASKGHLREIKTLKSIHSDYSIEFSNIPEKESHIESMRKMIQQYPPENVILATDDDREGEAIAWHICDLFGLPVTTTRRILFHEITRPALLKAVENPVILNMNTIQSQKARQILDMTVGFSITPYLWKYIYSSKTNPLSAGRCQSASLRLVYDNYKEQEKKKGPEKIYKTTATFFSKNIPFVLNHDFSDQESVRTFLNQSIRFRYQMSIGDSKNSIQGPPKPFNTSRLLQTASNVLHISPKQTMMYCQKLYQEGHITYMRTDSTKYAGDFLEKSKAFIEEKWGASYVGPLETLENKDNLNPHEAIRVTHLECKSLTDALEPHLQSVYKLIWHNTVESCMSEAKYKVLNASITAPMNYSYSYEIEIPLFLGWKICKQVTDKTPTTTREQMDGASIFLYLEALQMIPPQAKQMDPLFSQNNSCSSIVPHKIESNTHFKNKHTYYTEASLIKKLEEWGIGRPSTFSLLVDTIQERGYIQKKSTEGELLDCVDFVLRDNVLEEVITKKKWGNETNKLMMEPLGILAIEFLIQHFNELFSYEYTQKMEKELDDVVIRGSSPYKICDECSQKIGELSKQMKQIEKQKYSIEDGYELVFQSYGPVLRKMDASGTVQYKSIKKDITIDLDKLQKNQYCLTDLLEIKNEILGTYENTTIFLKTGQYGPYVEWGEQTKSIKTLDKPLNEIILEDVIPFITPLKNSIRPADEFSSKLPVTDLNEAPLQGEDQNLHRYRAEGERAEGEEERKGGEEERKPPTTNVLRVIDDYMSIRKGKYGPYLYYKTNEMKKPEFFPIKGIRYNTMNMEELKTWINKKYNIPRTIKYN